MLRISAIIIICLYLSSCKSEPSTKEQEVDEQQESSEADNQEELSDHAKECLNAINITITPKSGRIYTGTIGEFPIELFYYSKHYFEPNEIKGGYLYENNNSFFDLSGDIEGGDIWLARYKDGDLHEEFDLYETPDGLEGKWSKGEKTLDVSLQLIIWSTEIQEAFIEIIQQEISLLDLEIYDPEDFSDLEMKDGTMVINVHLKGEAGSTNIFDLYHLITIDSNQNIMYYHIHGNSYTYSQLYDLEGNEVERTGENIKKENYEIIQIDLVENNKGKSHIVDSIKFEDSTFIEFRIFPSHIAFTDTEKFGVISYDKDNRKLK